MVFCRRHLRNDAVRRNFVCFSPLNFKLVFIDKDNKMTTALEITLQNLSTSPLSKEELEKGMRYFSGAVTCLLNMRMEILRESGHINKSIDQGAGTVSYTHLTLPTKLEV